MTMPKAWIPPYVPATQVQARAATSRSQHPYCPDPPECAAIANWYDTRHRSVFRYVRA